MGENERFRERDAQQRSGDQESIQAPASLLPAVLAHLGLESAYVEPSPDDLLKVLRDEAWQVRIRAVRMFGVQAKATGLALEPLIVALHDPIWQVRAMAVLALAEQGARMPLEPVADALNDEESAVRAVAARALGLSGERAPLEVLVTATTDPAWLVREAVLLALGELGQRAPVLSLVSALNDEDAAVREVAMLALQQAHPSIAATVVAQTPPTPVQRLFDAMSGQLNVPPEQYMEKQAMLEEMFNESTSMPDLDKQHVPHQPVMMRKRSQRHVWEKVIAALLLVGLLFSWLAITQRFSFSASGPGQSTLTQIVLSPTQPGKTLSPNQQGKTLYSFQGRGNIAIGGWTADSRYLSFSDDTNATPGQYVNGKSGAHIYAWDARAHKITEALKLPTEPITAQAFYFVGPDRYVTVSDDQGVYQVWDYVSGQMLLSFNDAVQYPSWSNDGKLIAFINRNNGMVEIWDFTTRSKIAAYPDPLPNSFELQWSPDGRYIAAGSNARVFTIWDALTGKVALSVSPTDVAQLTWSPDSRRVLITMPAVKGMQIWDVSTGKLLAASSDFAYNPQWTSDGTHIISSDSYQAGGSTWTIWDARTGHTTLTLPAASSSAVSNQSRSIAVSNGSNDIQVWDAASGHQVLTYQGHPANTRILNISWSNDDRYIASLDSDHTLLVWDVRTGKTLRSYHVPPLQAPDPMGVWSPNLVWSPDNTFIALAGQHSQLAVLQVG